MYPQLSLENWNVVEANVVVLRGLRTVFETTVHSSQSSDFDSAIIAKCSLLSESLFYS